MEIVFMTVLVHLARLSSWFKMTHWSVCCVMNHPSQFTVCARTSSALIRRSSGMTSFLSVNLLRSLKGQEKRVSDARYVFPIGKRLFLFLFFI
ncbi:hypothetical protein L210DRAFT_3543388, partial [Boletus edulis BED1]